MTAPLLPFRASSTELLMNRSRRQLLVFGLAAALTPGHRLWAAPLPTPAGPTGPFYPDRIPIDHDADLTRVAGQAGRAQGEVVDLGGRLLDLNGRPIAGAQIEIWQCDAFGRYHHPRDRGRELDANFQGFGVTQTGDDGGYRFRTIKPVPYPGRTPHIHYAVRLPGQRPFTTQLYVAGEARNQRDGLYRRIPVTQRHLVEAVFESGSDGLQAQFDLILEATPSA